VKLRLPLLRAVQVPLNPESVQPAAPLRLKAIFLRSAVPKLPLMDSEEAFSVEAELAEMKVTAPEELDRLTAPAASDPPPNARAPVVLTVKGLAPAATLPPEPTVSVPPLTVLLPPLRVRVFVPVPRLPPVWLKVPPTLTAPLIVTAPVTVRLTKSGLAALPPVSVTVWPVPLKLALAPLSTNPAALMSAAVPSSIPCVRVICPLLSPPDSWRVLVVSVLFSVMGPNAWALEASVTGVLEPLKVIVEPLLV
jgi:hypothetical protein